MTRTINHWILVVREQRIGKTLLEAPDILQNRIRNHFWAFAEHAKGLRSVKKGDQAVIYSSGKTRKEFVGLCKINSDPYPLNKRRREMVIGNPSYAVDIDDINLFTQPKLIKTLLHKLNFVRSKENWGAYFQGSAIRISEDDYAILANA